jgi:hypothetical protein
MVFTRLCQAVIFCLSFWITFASAESFEFVALGDTAYCPEVDNPRYERLIERINAARPAFSIHVGDIGNPQTGSCTDDVVDTVAEQFSMFNHPLIYTPGDNEWTDCRGPFDPYERLETLRKRFFSEPLSLGSKPFPVVRQSDVSEHKQMVENLRWQWHDVQFATIHTPGGHNGLAIGTDQALLEFNTRNRANIDWIQRTFEIAKQDNARAVVLVFHVNMYRAIYNSSPGYAAMKRTLRRETANFNGQVLFINGDSHDFLIDKPHLSEGVPREGFKVTRLVVDGSPWLRAVRITVDLDSPSVFGFIPLSMENEERTAAEYQLCRSLFR